MVICLLPFVVLAQQRPRPSITLPPEFAINLTNQLLSAIGPDLPENAYMPAFMKDRIRWVYIQEGQKKLTIKLTNDNNQSGYTLMSSNYQGGVPVIEIYASQLSAKAWFEEKLMSGINQRLKNAFAITMVHEAVHLEKPAQFFRQENLNQQIADREELRAWRKTDELVIGELIQKRQPLDQGYIEMHELLPKCGKRPDCPEFTSFLNGYNRIR